MKKFLFFAVFALSAELFAQGYEELMAKGIAAHTRSRAGQGGADEAAELFQKALDIKKDALTKAWLGSAWALKGDEASNVINKVRFVLKGCKMLDEAVKKDGGNVMIRRIRAETYSSLPEDVFGKFSTAENDLLFLMERYRESKADFAPYYDGAWAFWFYGRWISVRGRGDEGKKYIDFAIENAQDEDLKAVMAAAR